MKLEVDWTDWTKGKFRNRVVVPWVAPIVAVSKEAFLLNYNRNSRKPHLNQLITKARKVMMIDHAHITASRSIRQPAGERRTPLLSKFLRYYHQVDDAMEITEHKIKIYVRPLRFLCAGVGRFVSLSYTHTRAVDTYPTRLCRDLCCWRTDDVDEGQPSPIDHLARACSWKGVCEESIIWILCVQSIKRWTSLSFEKMNRGFYVFYREKQRSCKPMLEVLVSSFYTTLALLSFISFLMTEREYSKKKAFTEMIKMFGKNV